jgi:predicted nucleic acid-binding protein
MSLVVDASVAVKWVLPEAASERAVAVRHEGEDLIAPALVYAEIGSALWRAVLRGDVAATEAPRALSAAAAHYGRIIPLSELAESALQLAMQLRHPIYDCFYLALAKRERCPLITADAKLIAAGKRTKGIELRAL